MFSSDDAAWVLKQLGAMFVMYGKPVPEPVVLNMLVDDVEPFGIPVVQKALKRLRATYDGRSPITSALLLRACESVAGRLSPDEAWSVALRARDEATTVVWTDEIERGWWAASELLKGRGDVVGARRAFLEAYERACNESRELERLPTLRVSLGTDVQGRAVALDVASKQGIDVARLEGEEVERLLGVSSSPMLLTHDDHQRALPPAEIKSRLLALRESLRTVPERQEAARIKRAQVKHAELKEKKAAVQAQALAYIEAHHADEVAPVAKKTIRKQARKQQTTHAST